MSAVPLNERVIVALDVSTEREALDLVRSLKSRIRYFKIGLQLFTALGPGIVRKVAREDVKVFLDLKLHDIPNTVARAASEAAWLDVEMMTLHTLGGEAMMRETVTAMHGFADREKRPAPKLLGVTVLTSIDQNGLASLGFSPDPESQVMRLARLAKRSGLDGVVASPRELPAIRREFPEGFLIVTPGIRSSGQETGDQARTLSAPQAIADGADFVVIGRPVTRADDPLEAVLALLGELEGV